MIVRPLAALVTPERRAGAFPARPRRTARARAALVLVLGACAGPPPTAPAAPPPTPVTSTGPVAATVDGEAIHLSEVRDAVRSTGLSPLDALHRLEQERALLHRAARAGIAAGDTDAAARRRAAVQALLRARVEEPISEASIPDEEIAARYAATRASWARPERRASLHLLATPGDPHDPGATAAAESFVAEALTRLASSADPAATAQALAADVGDARPFTARIESVPATSRHGSLEEPYLAALFEVDSAGVVPHPVSTRYGVHAVVVTSIEPAFEISLAEATPILRRQLLAEHRHAALEALASQLERQTPVLVEERLVATVVSSDLGLAEPSAPEPARGTP